MSSDLKRRLTDTVAQSVFVAIECTNNGYNHSASTRQPFAAKDIIIDILRTMENSERVDRNAGC